MKKMLNQFLKVLAIGLFGCTLMITSCKEDDSIDVREVKFNVGADRTQITVTESIDYSDNSKDVASREWMFQGGSIPTSANQAETVTYPDSGRFETTLTVNFNDGKAEERLFYVDVRPFVETDFAASATTLVFGNEVTFTNTTQFMPLINSFQDSPNFEDEKETWEWEFEGGTPATSTEESPVIRYSTVGTYKVKLTANRNYPSHSDTEEKIGYINVVDVAVISPDAVHTCDFGSTLRVTYPESLAPVPANGVDAFTVNADGAAVGITSIEVDANNDMSLIFTLDAPITDGQAVTLDYNPNTSLFTAQSGSIFAPLADALVENRVASLFIGNMDFEVGLVGDFPPGFGTWNGSSGNNEKYMIVDDADAPSGNNSLMWTYDGDDLGWVVEGASADAVPLTVGGTYRIVYYAKTSVDGSLLDVRIIEPGWAGFSNVGTQPLTTDWQEYSFEYTTAEAGSNTWKIWWATPAGLDTYDMHIDNIKIYYLGCD